jgi:hypothetical protein
MGAARVRAAELGCGAVSSGDGREEARRRNKSRRRMGDLTG